MGRTLLEFISSRLANTVRATPTPSSDPPIRRRASAPGGRFGSRPSRGRPAPRAATTGAPDAPGAVKSRTSATQVAPAYAACPEGKDEPTGCTRPSGGRGRPTRNFSSVELSGVTVSVTPNASSATNRRRAKSTTATAASDSTQPRPRPSQLKPGRDPSEAMYGCPASLPTSADRYQAAPQARPAPSPTLRPAATRPRRTPAWDGAGNAPDEPRGGSCVHGQSPRSFSEPLLNNREDSTAGIALRL